jgi:hypothetical protein
VITVYGAEGARIREVSVPVQRRAYNSEKLARAKTAELNAALNADARARVSALCAPNLLPSSTPVFSRFVPGPDGELWVELFDEDQSAAARFIVLNAAGRPIAAVSLPSQFRLDEAGHDHLVGVETDVDQIEHIVLCRLVR